MAIKNKVGIRGPQILKDYLKKRKIPQAVALCIALLQTHQISGPYECAIATTRLLGAIISNFSEKLLVNALIERVREVGLQLIKTRPGELTIGNMLRRVLGLIKECCFDQDEEEEKFDVAAYITTAMANLSEGKTAGLDNDDDEEVLLDRLPSKPAKKEQIIPADKLVKDIILDAVSGIAEIIEELESTAELTAAFAPNYILPTDVILIHGSSTLAYRFLSHAAAAATCSGFVVFVIDDGTGFTLPETLNLALTGKTITDEVLEAQEIGEADDEEAEDSKPLATKNVSVTILPLSSVYAIMSSVTKVLIAPDAVFPNGEVLAQAGTASIVMAAEAFNVPVLALSGTYHFHPIDAPKASAEFQGSMLGNTGYAVGLEEDQGGEADDEDDEAEILKDGPPHGAFYKSEFLDGDGIELFVTNVGVCGRSSIPRIMSEQYDDEYVRLGIESEEAGESTTTIVLNITEEEIVIEG